MTAELHLVIPGLRGPLPPEVRESELLAPRLPALERIFAQARRETVAPRNLYEHLHSLFELAPGELAAGAFGWLGEGNDPADAYWMRADPVHLQPDRDALMLFDASALELQSAEAAELVADCNRLLAQDGLELLAPAPDRWYLRAQAPIALTTTPVAAVAGRYIGERLPAGPDAGRWMGLMTELQMLLHQADANARREERGALPVNGVWFWGAGPLPSRFEASWRTLAADEPVARGLGRAAGASVHDLPNTADRLVVDGATLVVLTAPAEALRAGDIAGWRQALDRLERDWFAPLLARVKAGALTTLSIDTEQTRLRLARRDLNRFWRRPRPLRQYLEF